MKPRPPKGPAKSRTWDCLVQLFLSGSDEKWQRVLRVVAEGQGAHLIAVALERRRLPKNVYLGSELMRERLLGEEMAYLERVFHELDVDTGEWWFL